MRPGQPHETGSLPSQGQASLAEGEEGADDEVVVHLDEDRSPPQQREEEEELSDGLDGTNMRRSGRG